MKNIFIITEINKNVGSGHYSRQLSLADYLSKKDKKIYFFSNAKHFFSPNKNIKIVENINKKIILKKIQSLRPRLIIIDVLQKNISKFSYLKNLSKIILVLSDVKHNYPKFGQLIVNFGKNLEKNFKQKSNEISGRDILWFRDEFDKLQIKKIKNRQYDLIICNGGTDNQEISIKEMKILEASLKTYKIILVITNLFKNKKKIIQFAKKSKHNYKVIYNSLKISSLMSNAKLSLMNGGNVRYELCKTGTPFINVPINKVQENFSRYFVNLNVCDTFKYEKLKFSEKFNRLIYFMLDDVKLLQKRSDKMTRLFNKDGRKTLNKLIDDLLIF